MEPPGRVVFLLFFTVAVQILRPSFAEDTDIDLSTITYSPIDDEKSTTQKETASSTEMPLSAADMALDGEGTDSTDSVTEPPVVRPTPEFKVSDKYTGQPCILAKLNVTFVIKYFLQDKGNQEAEIPLPQEAIVEGDCGKGDDSSIIISWSVFKFRMHFAKSPVGDAWYVDGLSLNFFPTADYFDPGAAEAGAQELLSADDLTLFLSPSGKSFRCRATREVGLYKAGGAKKGTIRFQGILIQPFAILTAGTYGPEFPCLEDAGSRRLRDETVPVAVGSTFAVVVLLTVTGYGVYRYFKVKKIEYDTME